jgi:SAM-dependent methyltransferase
MGCVCPAKRIARCDRWVAGVDPMDVYRFPKYYEIAFGFRDARKDVDFFEAAIAKFSKVEVRSVLELASGLSPYLTEWHRRGYKYFGLDLSEDMIATARQRAHSAGIPLRVFRRDMNNFRLSRVKVDLAYVLLGSLYATSNRQLFSHFNSVARVLSRGGLYVMDGVIHARLLSKNRQRWTIRKDKITVTTTYSAEVIDHLAQTHYEHLVLDINEGGKKRRIESRVLHKFFFPQEFLSLVECHEAFEFVTWCSDFDLKRAPASDAQNVVILRRV